METIERERIKSETKKKSPGTKQSITQQTTTQQTPRQQKSVRHKRAASLGPCAQQILDHMATAVVIIDRQCRIIGVNPAAENLFACSKTRLTGENFVSFFRPSEAFTQQLTQALANRHAFTHRDLALTVPGRDPPTLDCTVTSTLQSEDEEIAIIELIEKDRFSRINRDQTLLSNHQATRLLLKGLAHEVKNPLGGILGAAQLMRREMEGEQYAEFLNIIIEETDRLKNLVDRMLGPRNLPVMTKNNIHEIIERVMTILRAEGTGRTCIYRDYDVSLPEVEADRDRLKQALLNIMRNAVQALNESEALERPTMTVKTRILRQYTISQRRHRLALCIQIIDNGPGIPESLMESIFLPMVSSRAEGNGLGLSIAQDIINHHDGLIECDSKSGCTRFTLILPLEQSP